MVFYDDVFPGIHAREWITNAAMLYMIDHLVQTLPPEDEDLLEVDWIFLPSLNPDGYEYTWTTDRDWRATRYECALSSWGRIKCVLIATRHVIPENLCVGVDANRNFGHHWAEGGSSAISCSEVYHGPEPWSEIEIVNMRDYINGLGDAVVFYQGLHSASQEIMYPWGYKCTLEGNDDADVQDEVAVQVSK